MNSLLVEKANEGDLEQILELQKKAYQSEAEICGDYNIPPLTQTMEGIKEDFNKQVILKIENEGRVIGSIRAYEKDNVCYIGRVIVHPDHQNRGIGKVLMRAIEEQFRGCAAYSLFTGKKSARNINFYSKLGYIIKREEKNNDALTFVYLEKDNPSIAGI